MAKTLQICIVINFKIYFENVSLLAENYFLSYHF